MRHLKLCLHSSLILLIIEYFGLDVKALLPYHITPEHYNIILYQESIESNLFYGECQTFINISSATRNIMLYAQKPQIQILTFRLREVNPSKNYEWQIHGYNNEYNNETHILNYRFVDEISPGKYILETQFDIILDNDTEGLFKTFYMNENGNTTWLVATYFLPARARRMFPCWDEPNFQATFNISVKHEKKYSVLSNMPVRSIQTFKNYATHLWTHFVETPRMPTYLVAIMISDFPITPATKINLRYRQPIESQLQYARYIIYTISHHLEHEWNCKNYAKVDHVAIPGFRHRSMGNLGLIFYRETDIVYDENIYSVAQQANIALLIGREVARQCFYVSKVPWIHQWINEGIATLYAVHTIDKIIPDSRMMDLFVIQTQQESLRLDIRSIMSTISSISYNSYNSDELNLNSYFYYLKAPCLFRMLQFAITEEVFWRGVKTFYNFVKFKYSINSEDLWAAIQLFLNISKHVYHFNVREWMDSWIRMKNYPVLKVVQHTTRYRDVIIFIDNLNTLGAPSPIPMTYTTQGDFTSFGIRSTGINKWLLPYEYNEIIIPVNHSDIYTIVNLQQVGYYRVKYGDLQWRKIINYINYTPMIHQRIHVLNRAQLIDDAFHFVIHDQLDLSTFLDFTRFLKNDTDFAAWYPMIKALEYMSNFFSFDESLNVKVYMRQLLHGLLENIKYVETIDDNAFTKRLREESAKWACILLDPMCLRHAADKFISYFGNPKEHRCGRLSLWWKKWTFCNGLLHTESEYYLQNTNFRELWIFIEYLMIADDQILKYLYCLDFPYNTLSHLYMLANHSSVSSNRITRQYQLMRANDRVKIFFLSIERHARSDTILEHLLDHFDQIKPREISKIAALIHIINNVNSLEQLDKVNQIIQLITSHIDKRILLIDKKINTRFSEITSQIFYYHTHIEDYKKK